MDAWRGRCEKGSGDSWGLTEEIRREGQLLVTSAAGVVPTKSNNCCELAGTRGKFGGLGAQLTNSAEVAGAAAEPIQETAAKLAYEQNQEWQQLARGRRDINQLARGRCN